jgi:transcriptional regulator with XRE-family HTH domain
MENDVGDWAAVGREVQARRIELDLTQDEAARRSDGRVSRVTWGRIENAASKSYSARTLVGVCRALGWSDDSVHRIFRGLEPRLAHVENVGIPVSRSVLDAITGDQALDPAAKELLLAVYRILVAQAADRR